MALRIVTIVASLVVLLAIHIRAEGTQDKDVQIQSSHLDQVSNADLHEGHIRSRIVRSAGKGGPRGRKQKPGRRSTKGKKKSSKAVIGRSNKKKKKPGKQTNQKKPAKKSKKQHKKRRTKKKTTKKKKKNINKKKKRGENKKTKGKSIKKNCKEGKEKCKKKGKKGNRKAKKHTKKKCKNGKEQCKKNGKKGNRKAKKHTTKKCKGGKGKCKKNGKKGNTKGKKRNGNKGKKRNDNKSNKKKKTKHNKKHLKKQKKISKKKQFIGKFRAAVCEDCVVKLANYAKLYVAQAKNRKQQILRMEAACKTSKKKVAKKGLFNGPYQQLLDNAGGNKSDPKCKGKSIGKSTGGNATTASDGAASVADMITLEACNNSIGNNCNSCQLDDPKQLKKAQDCKKAMVSFIGKMDNCLNVTKFANQAALCPCVDAIDNTNKTLETQIRDCKWVTAASIKEVANKKKCVGEFSKCRKAEDASVGHIHKCKLPLLKCGGVTTVDQAKTDLPILKNLKTELDATEAKMKKGFTNNNLPAVNTSSDSKTPAGLSDFIKNPSGSSRAASKCRQLAQAFLKFNESAVGTGESANANLNGTEASNTTDILKVMKTRDFDSEVADCQKSTKQQLVLYVINRFYGATMILWRTTIVDVKIVVLTLVISNAASEDDSATTAAAGGATTAAAGATTAAAGATTAAAGATTAAAGATTAAAGATTAAAGATTAAAGATTAAAGATTAAAGVTTAAAGATTAATGATTAAAGATTAAAGATTATAGATTAAAGATTAAAGATTAAPGATPVSAGATTAATTAAVSTARAQGRKKRFMETMQWLKQRVLKA